MQQTPPRSSLLEVCFTNSRQAGLLCVAKQTQSVSEARWAFGRGMRWQGRRRRGCVPSCWGRGRPLGSEHPLLWGGAAPWENPGTQAQPKPLLVERGGAKALDYSAFLSELSSLVPLAFLGTSVPLAVAYTWVEKASPIAVQDLTASLRPLGSGTV